MLEMAAKDDIIGAIFFYRKAYWFSYLVDALLRL
jgi:hypothetical protein